MIVATIETRFNHLPGMAARKAAKAKEIDQLAVFKVAAVADPLTPVDTGALKNNKTIGANFVHWHQFYAGFVELGTWRMAPRLFATTAVNQVRPGWIAAHEANARAL